MVQMTQDSYDPKDSGKKVDLLLRKLAVLQDKIMVRSNIYAKTHAKEITRPLLRGKVISDKSDVLVGETFGLDIEITNIGRIPVAIDGIEEILPLGIQLTKHPVHYDFGDSYLDMNRKVLKPAMTERLRLSALTFEKGTFTISPRTLYTDAKGTQRLLNLEPITIKAEEVVLPDRVSTGYKDLDNLLLGGLPNGYATVLKSVSCDETKLVVKRFLEKGCKDGETTIYVTIHANRWEKFAEENPNFYLFVCNPQMNTTIEARPNVIKLRGVENLTDISIPLMSTLRKIAKTGEKPRRICIEILSDILLQHHAVQTRKWLIGLAAELRSRTFTTLAVLNPHMHPQEEVEAVLDLFEGEIEIYEKENRKLLRIKKMLGQDYLDSEIPLKKERLVTMGTARTWKFRKY